MGNIAKLETSQPKSKTFSQALVALQSDIRPAIKQAENEGFKRGGKASRYADLCAVWEAVKDPLKTHGFAVVQLPQFEGETMFLETILLHDSGEAMTGRYPLKPAKQDPQGYGSAITYARRYAICAMLGVIADEDDDGNAASGVKSAPPSRPATAPVTHPEDPDVTAGVTNWCDKSKNEISGFEVIGQLLEWQEKNLGALDRLKRKAKPAFDDLMRHYRSKSDELSGDK